MPIVDPVNLPTTTRGKTTKRKTAALRSEPSRSTLWRRAHGKASWTGKAANQQYLSPVEEKALLDYVLPMSERGYSLPVKFLRSSAPMIARQRSSALQTPAVDDDIRPPGKNWPQGFYKRHPELKAT